MAKKYKSIISDDFQIKFGGTPAWTKISRMCKAKFVNKDKTGTITFVDGAEEMLKTGEQRNLRIELSDQDLATLDNLEALSGGSYPVYINFGKVNGKGQDFYAPEVAIFKDTEWESPSGDGLRNAILLQPVKQSSNVTVTPSSGLPTSSWSTANSSPQSSTNPYWIIIET